MERRSASPLPPSSATTSPAARSSRTPPHFVTNTAAIAFIAAIAVAARLSLDDVGLSRDALPAGLRVGCLAVLVVGVVVAAGVTVAAATRPSWVTTSDGRQAMSSCRPSSKFPSAPSCSRSSRSVAYSVRCSIACRARGERWLRRRCCSDCGTCRSMVRSGSGWRRRRVRRHRGDHGGGSRVPAHEGPTPGASSHRGSPTGRRTASPS
jgi:hypothetical protein